MRKLNQEQVDYIVAKASVAALDAHGELALHAYEETGRGVFEDKAEPRLRDIVDHCCETRREH